MATSKIKVDTGKYQHGENDIAHTYPNVDKAIAAMLKRL